MSMDTETVRRVVADAILKEKGKRIKMLIEKGVPESFIMELYEMSEDTYGQVYNRLFPFGRFTGPFGKYVEKDIKIRMFKKAEYTEEEVQGMIEEDPLFLPEEVESRIKEVAKKEAHIQLIKEFLQEGKTEEWIRNQLFLTHAEFMAYKHETEKI